MRSVVFQLVHTATLRAVWDVSVTFVGGVTPTPAVMTLWHTRVHAGGLYSRGPASNVNSMIDEGHSPLAILRVSQVKPDRAGV
jgi:hypothetical protein